MARFGVLATCISQLKNLKSCQKTYFSANIRLTNRRFVVNVCYHYMVDTTIYAELLGVIHNGRYLDCYNYRLYEMQEVHTNLPIIGVDCQFGKDYPSLELVYNEGYYLSYWENVMTTYWIALKNQTIKITKITAGKVNREKKKIVITDRIVFDNCIEAVNYMLKKADYFQN